MVHTGSNELHSISRGNMTGLPLFSQAILCNFGIKCSATGTCSKRLSTLRRKWNRITHSGKIMASWLREAMRPCTILLMLYEVQPAAESTGKDWISSRRARVPKTGGPSLKNCQWSLKPRDPESPTPSSASWTCRAALHHRAIRPNHTS